MSVRQGCVCALIALAWNSAAPAAGSHRVRRAPGSANTAQNHDPAGSSDGTTLTVNRKN